MSSKLDAAEVVQAQACFLPLSEDSLPLMGPVPGVQGLYMATGALHLLALCMSCCLAS